MLTKLEAASSASDRIEEQEVANIPSKNGFQPQERVPLFDLRKQEKRTMYELTLSSVHHHQKFAIKEQSGGSANLQNTSNFQI